MCYYYFSNRQLHQECKFALLGFRSSTGSGSDKWTPALTPWPNQSLPPLCVCVWVQSTFVLNLDEEMQARDHFVCSWIQLRNVNFADQLTTEDACIGFSLRTSIDWILSSVSLWNHLPLWIWPTLMQVFLMYKLTQVLMAYLQSLSGWEHESSFPIQPLIPPNKISV